MTSATRLIPGGKDVRLWPSEGGGAARQFV